MANVCILDYGSGNVKSVYNLFSTIADRVVISNSPLDIEEASHIVLPGVGAFGAAMRRIRQTIPLDIVERVVVKEKKPFLGICVGMQVLADQGLEFGEHSGLGWIGGTVDRLETGALPLPHIGWNGVTPNGESPLFSGLENEPDFYFVHSFVFRATATQDVLATAEYGEQFTAAVQHENIYGVQFHPEKSQRAGIRFAKNFLSL